MEKERKIQESGYQDITWLVGKVFIDREFLGHIEEEGFEAVYKECPYGDLSDDQKETFESAFAQRELRLLAYIWWTVYDYLRRQGSIASTRAPWRP